ncbi:hypothetical protein Tco_0885893 [Tanacetum coccineum]
MDREIKHLKRSRIPIIKVQIYQKSQENRQKTGKHGHKNGRVYKSQEFKAKARKSQASSQPWSTEVNSLEDKSLMLPVRKYCKVLLADNKSTSILQVVSEHELKGASSLNSQNIAFMSAEIKGSTSRQSTADDKSEIITKGYAQASSSKLKETLNSSFNSDEIICSFFAQQASMPETHDDKD